MSLNLDEALAELEREMGGVSVTEETALEGELLDKEAVADKKPVDEQPGVIEGEVITADELDKELEELESILEDDPVAAEMNELDALLDELEEAPTTSKPAKKQPIKEDKLKKIAENAGAFSSADEEEELAPTVRHKSKSFTKKPAKPAKPSKTAGASSSSEPGEATGDGSAFDSLMSRLGAVSDEGMSIVLAGQIVGETGKTEAELKDHLRDVINGMSKKVGEKAINILAHLQGHASMSVYTKIAIEQLVANGKLTSAELVERYMSRPYSVGTSRSQAGQMMQLLPALNIATKTGRGELKLNEDSEILKLLKAA